MKTKKIFGIFLALLTIGFVGCSDSKENNPDDDLSMTIWAVDNVLADIEITPENAEEKVIIGDEIKTKMRPTGTTYHLYHSEYDANIGNVVISFQGSEDEINADFMFETIDNILYLNITYSDGDTDSYRILNGNYFYLIKDFTQLYKQSYPNLIKAEGIEKISIPR
jgi:hypothetical protein